MFQGYSGAADHMPCMLTPGCSVDVLARRVHSHRSHPVRKQLGRRGLHRCCEPLRVRRCVGSRVYGARAASQLLRPSSTHLPRMHSGCRSYLQTIRRVGFGPVPSQVRRFSRFVLIVGCVCWSRSGPDATDTSRDVRNVVWAGSCQGGRGSTPRMVSRFWRRVPCRREGTMTSPGWHYGSRTSHRCRLSGARLQAHP